jgi:hypothetical protein
MRLRRQEPPPQDEMFRNRLENLIDQRHELVGDCGATRYPD